MWGWGNNYQNVLGLPEAIVRVPTKLPIGCRAQLALLAMSGQQVLDQSVDGSHMVRAVSPRWVHGVVAFLLQTCSA